MPRITKPLSDTEIKKSKEKEKVYKLSDGQGLYLVIKTNGTKFFRFDYEIDGKRKSMSFGVYPDISLKEARIKRDESKQLIKNCIDPIREKRNQDMVTFKDITEKWLDIMKNEWKEVTYIKAKSVITNNTYPCIGGKNIKDIKRTDILDLIKIMETRGILESANRLLNYIERIYKYAVTYNLVEHNIIADIDKRNAIKKPQVTHFPAILKEPEIKVLMKDIQSYGKTFRSDISTVYALQLAPFVFLRPYNLRNLTWDEIDLKKTLIKISGEKMKTGNDFIIPLSSQAIKIINKIKPYSYHRSDLVFPSPTSNLKPISENTLNQALMRLGYKGVMTAHGFRAMFSTIAHEKIAEHGFHSDIIESCLAHIDSNKVKSAYNRDSKMKYFEEKKGLLQWWGKWLKLHNEK